MAYFFHPAYCAPFGQRKARTGYSAVPRIFHSGGGGATLCQTEGTRQIVIKIKNSLEIKHFNPQEKS